MTPTVFFNFGVHESKAMQSKCKFKLKVNLLKPSQSKDWKVIPIIQNWRELIMQSKTHIYSSSFN